MTEKPSEDSVSVGKCSGDRQRPVIGVQLVKSCVREVHSNVYKCFIKRLVTNGFKVWSKPFDGSLDTKWKLIVSREDTTDETPTLCLSLYNVNHIQKDYSSATEKTSQLMVTSIDCCVNTVNIYGKEVVFSKLDIPVTSRMTKLFEYDMNAIFDPMYGYSPDGHRLAIELKFDITGNSSTDPELVGLKPSKNRFKSLNFDSLNISQLSFKDCADQLGDNQIVTFYVNDKKFLFRKSLLAQKSTVFDQLFNECHGLQSLRVMNITDQVFDDFMRFVTTGTLDKVMSNDLDVLIVAKRYGVKELEEWCLNAITANMSVDNVIQYLKQSKANRLEALMKKALIFIDQNYNQLIATQEWKQNFAFVLKIGQNFLSEK